MDLAVLLDELDVDTRLGGLLREEPIVGVQDVVGSEKECDWGPVLPGRR